MTVLQVLQKSALIASFVTVMMIVIEYVDARWGGVFTKRLRAGGPTQTIIAALLGATPGCLGAFVTVSLFAQRRLSAGALVAAMIATSGDEAFVMFAMFPSQAFALTVALAVLGVLVGMAVDAALGKRAISADACCDFSKEHKEACECLSAESVVATWKSPSLLRVGVSGLFVGAAVLIALGWLGPAAWNWKRVTLIFVVAIGLFVVVSVPERFLRNHLVKHVLWRHAPKIFAWTAATLAVMAFVDARYDLAALVSDNRWGVLALASGLGLIPESGPHLVFTTMYAQGAAPLSVLVASSIVQDGHGMLPLLAQSRGWFFLIKGINLLAGIAVGAVMLALGW